MMRKMRISPVLAVILLPICSCTRAPSFDCSKASTAVEQSICSSRQLSELDESLAAAYRKATAAGNSEAVTNRQREWLRNERNKCQDIACISNAYTKRIAELTGPMSADAARPSPPTACDGMASLLRAAPQDNPWDVLTKAARPLVDTKGETETRALLGNVADDAEALDRFVSRFNPSDELRGAWIDAVEESHVDVRRLADSDLHMITNTGGSASCYRFTFFRAPAGGQAQLLPPLPLKSDRDGENLICGKSGSDGYLARVGDVEGFLETHERGENFLQRGFSFSYRFVPLRDGRWDKACAVDAAYQARYRTSAVFVPAAGALTAAQLETLAAQIVERREAVGDAKDFSHGSPLSEMEKDEFARLAELIGKMDSEPVPTFGRDAELSAGQETLVAGESLPIVLDGRVYLLRLGTGQLGCCYFPGPILIFHALRDGKLEAVGSAVVEKSRGTLVSASARPSR